MFFGRWGRVSGHPRPEGRVGARATRGRRKCNGKAARPTRPGRRQQIEENDMGLLQEDKAIFYHPLNDADEHIQSKTWTGTADTSGAGKVGDAMSRVDIAASLAGDTGDYATAAAATRVAFCGWFAKPSSAPSQTAAPTTDSPILDAATSCSGTGVNGATVEVFVDDVSVGNADAAVAGGTWSKTGMAAVSTGEVVSAKQRSTGELQSVESNEVTVSAPLGFGAATEFLSADGADHMSVAAMSATKFVVAYRDNADSGHGTAKVGTVSGTDITFGAEVEFTTGAITYPAAVEIVSPTSVVVVWNEGGGKVKIGTVSGTDITFGAVATFLAGNAFYLSAAVLSATKLAVSCSDFADSSKGKSVAATISGGDITFGTPKEYNAGATSWPDSAALNATKFVVAYRDDNDSGHGTVKIGTVSGADVTFGAEAEFTPGGANYIAAALGATKFVVAYQDDNDSGHGTARVGTVSGADVTFGAEAEFQGAATVLHTSAAGLSSTQFSVAYLDGGDDDAKAKVGTVSGTDITFASAAEEFSTAEITSFATAALDAAVTPPGSTGSIVVVYRDVADSNHGTAKVGVLA